MAEFNTVIAYIDGASVPGRIAALEGGRGMMRVALDLEGTGVLAAPGTELVLEMHDGARFRVAVTEQAGEDAGDLRMKLLGKAG